MVKEVPQPSKYQCEHCDKVYTKVENAQKCESKGAPEFKYNIGDEVETIIQLTKISQTRMNLDTQRLFDIGGEFTRVKITDRYHLNHMPVYTFEHPQIQGQYWRYPELAFELRDKLNKLKEPILDEMIETKTMAITFNERALFFQEKWKAFRSYLNERRIARICSPEIIAEPIKPT